MQTIELNKMRWNETTALSLTQMEEIYGGDGCVTNVLAGVGMGATFGSAFGFPGMIIGGTVGGLLMATHCLR